MQALTDQMALFYQDPTEEEPVNDEKCTSRIPESSSADYITMEGIQKMFQKMLQEKNQK